MLELEASTIVRNPTVAFHTVETESSELESWIELHDEVGEGTAVLRYSSPETLRFMANMFDAAASELEQFKACEHTFQVFSS